MTCPRSHSQQTPNWDLQSRILSLLLSQLPRLRGKKWSGVLSIGVTRKSWQAGLKRGLSASKGRGRKGPGQTARTLCGLRALLSSPPRVQITRDRPDVPRSCLPGCQTLGPQGRAEMALNNAESQGQKPLFLSSRRLTTHAASVFGWHVSDAR